MKRSHNICTECEGEFHVDSAWRRSIDDELVCSDCASDLPEIGTGRRRNESGFFGYASKRLSWGSFESVDTAYLKTKAEARARIIEMVKKLWGEEITIIEEED